MSMTNACESDFLTLLFTNVAWANVGDASGVQPSATAGSLYVSLHTADPGETGTQTTSEIAYTSYARIAVARSGAGWTISATAPTQAANTSTITFPACTGSSGTATYFGIGTALTTAGHLLYSGAITTPGAGLAISTGITPQFAAGACVITQD